MFTVCQRYMIVPLRAQKRWGEQRQSKVIEPGRCWPWVSLLKKFLLHFTFHLLWLLASSRTILCSIAENTFCGVKVAPSPLPRWFLFFLPPIPHNSVSEFCWSIYALWMIRINLLLFSKLMWHFEGFHFIFQKSNKSLIFWYSKKYTCWWGVFQPDMEDFML